MKSHGEKRRVIKFLISLGYYGCDCVWRQTLRMLGRKPNATCVILYYHSVPNSHKRAFSRQMDIVSSLTSPISIEQPPELLPGKRYSAITFDDGFEDIIINAAPELVKRGIPATIFLTVAYFGRCAGWWPQSAPERQRRIAPVERWQQLDTGLIRFGSHTVTHPCLSSLNETEARRELIESRVILQELLKREIGTFSFPYGDFNQELLSWCRDAGYERVFTTMPSNAFQNENEFVSGRMKIEPTDWPLEFRLKLLGAYRWLPYASALKRILFGSI